MVGKINEILLMLLINIGPLKSRNYLGKMTLQRQLKNNLGKEMFLGLDYGKISLNLS